LSDDEGDDLITDGGLVVGLLDEAWPQPTAVVRRLWAFGPPTIERETPDDDFEDAVLGFYALNAKSGVRCKPDVTKESCTEFLSFADACTDPFLGVGRLQKLRP